MDAGHWSIDVVGEFDPADWTGFIYELEHLPTGRMYIGRKMFLAKRQKTKSNPSRTKESNWKEYTSSSDVINDLIQEEGKDKFAFRILLLCSGKCELNFEEESLQRARDVLRARLPDGTRQFFNNTIGYKNFAGLEKQTEETKRKMSEAQRGSQNSFFGKVHSVDTKRKLSEIHKGTKQSSEWVEKRIAGRRGRMCSDVTKERIRAGWTAERRAAMGKQSPEWIEKRIAPHRGRKRTPEQIENMLAGKRAGKLRRQAVLTTPPQV